MPIAGIHVGDFVLTPGGRSGEVISVRRVKGRERVGIRYTNGGVKASFDAAALRLWRSTEGSPPTGG